MSAAAKEVDSRVYFGALSVIVVETNDLEADIVTQIMAGFKVRSVHRIRGASEAEEHLKRDPGDLLVVGGTRRKEGDADEFDLVARIRRGQTSSRAVPIILLAGHTSQGNVLRARDCGASFVVAKPITPHVLFQRIMWLAKDSRPFVAGETYVGPDRRFQKLGPPAGTEGRRRDDLSLKVGAATLPNLSQSEIDAMLNGKGLPPVMATNLPAHTRKMAGLVNRPGGITASEAVSAAEANLETLRERGLEEIAAAVVRIQAIGEQLASEATGAAQSELYTLSNFLVGVSGVFGLAVLGEVAFSLCTLLDRLRMSGSWTMHPVKIHLDTVRLVYGGGLQGSEMSMIGPMLRQVVDRVAAAPA